MKKPVKIILIALLFGALVLIRMFEGTLFYDPLLEFFKTDHSTHALPEMQIGKLMLNVVLRFLLNTVVSLLIIWVAFRDKGFVKLSVWLYGILFLILFLLFTMLIMTSEDTGHMTLFYVRRFLIQPLFLLILLPAFYFQKRRGQ